MRRRDRLTPAGRVWLCTVMLPLVWDVWTEVHGRRHPDRPRHATASRHFAVCRRGRRGILVNVGVAYLVAHLYEWLPARWDPLRRWRFGGPS